MAIKWLIQSSWLFSFVADSLGLDCFVFACPCSLSSTSSSLWRCGDGFSHAQISPQVSLLVSQSAGFASAGFATRFDTVSAGFASAGFAELPGSALSRGGINQADRRFWSATSPPFMSAGVWELDQFTLVLCGCIGAHKFLAVLRELFDPVQRTRRELSCLQLEMLGWWFNRYNHVFQPEKPVYFDT